MTFAEIRKAVVAAAALIATSAPLLLDFEAFLPKGAVYGISVIAVIAGIIGVWAVPNRPLTAKVFAENVSETLYRAQDLIPMMRDLAREEVKQATATPAVSARVRPPEMAPAPSDPFAVPPIGG